MELYLCFQPTVTRREKGKKERAPRKAMTNELRSISNNSCVPLSSTFPSPFCPYILYTSRLQVKRV